MVPIAAIEYQIPSETELHKSWIEESSNLFYVEDAKVKAKQELIELINLLVQKKILVPLNKESVTIHELNKHLQDPKNGVYSSKYKERW